MELRSCEFAHAQSHTLLFSGNAFDISLRSIRNDNYSSRENRFQSGSDRSQPANDIESSKSSDVKPTQEAKKQSDSKGKSKNSAISQMFAKTAPAAGTKKEVKNKESEEKRNIVKSEEKPKETSKEKNVKSSAISQMFAKAPPKKIKPEEEKSSDGNKKDDSPGKENKNEPSDEKPINSKKREKLQETQPNAKRRKRIQVSLYLNKDIHLHIHTYVHTFLFFSL